MICVFLSVSYGQDEVKKSIYTFDITKFVLPTLNNVGSMNGTPFTVVTTNYIHYPRLTFGYTRSINEKLNLGIDLGYGNKLLSLYEINKDYQLIEFRPKVNYLFGVKKKSYFGLELFHVYNQDVFYNSNYRSSSFKKYSFEKANFKRNKSGLMIKYGHYYTVFKSFGFNFYGGVGLQKTTYSYSNVTKPLESIIEYDRHGYKNYIDEGSFHFAEFTLGVKLFFISK